MNTLTDDLASACKLALAKGVFGEDTRRELERAIDRYVLECARIEASRVIRARDEALLRARIQEKHAEWVREDKAFYAGEPLTADPPPPAPPTIDTEPPLPWPIPGGNIHNLLLAAYYAALEALKQMERAA